jgi:hypothetical protein
MAAGALLAVLRHWAMERREFYYLYVNLNNLAELALRQMAVKLLAQPSEAPSELDTLSDEERDARVLASFENLDLSALDALDLSKHDAEPLELPEPASSDEELDVEQYLARAYDTEEQLRERIDSHYSRVDLTAMDASLQELPKHLPALTGPLSATEIGNWLTVYEEGNDVLTNLTAEIRQLDMSLSRLG